MTATSASSGVVRAEPGDRLVVHGHRLGGAPRDGEILKVLGPDGRPPYLVRWSDDGHVSRLYPGSDAFVEHMTPARGRGRSSSDQKREEDRR